MEPQSGNSPLVVILGQTASGKSQLALDLAERWNGEIIAADSRTVYRGMDVATAKPSRADQARIRHHLIDILEPDQQFTVHDFQPLAQQAVVDIARRDKLPFLVGGTGLYIDAVLYDFSFRGGFDAAKRQKLERLSVDELQVLLEEQGVALPVNERNPRHLVRTIETGGVSAERHDLRPNTLIIGIDVAKETLQERITARVDAMLAAGLEKEALTLAGKYGWSCPRLQTIGYQEFEAYSQGESTIQEVRQAIITHTQQYAKRQKTWFRRNKSIRWISKAEEAVELVTTFLNK